MAELIDKLKAGIIGFVLILAGFGGATYLTQDQIDNGFVCTSTEKLAICTGTPTHPDALSTTSSSCYYTNGEPRDTYTRCTDGIFVPLKDYAASKGVTIDQFLLGALNEEPEQEQEQNTKPSDKTGGGVCDNTGCTYND